MICEYIKLKSDVRRSYGVETKYVDFQKRATAFPYKATIIGRNMEMCQLDGRLSKESFDLSIAFLNNQSYLIKFWEQDTNIGTLGSVVSMVGKMIKEKSTDALYETMEPKIFDQNNNQIGECKYMTVKEEGMQSYYYWKLILNGIELNTYIVGHGKNEILFCMYNSNNEMVATVSKRMNIKNGKSRYTMYMISDEWFQYVAIATSIVHHINYEGKSVDKDGFGLGSHHQALNTFQKGLLDKYQPNFIQNIINKEGINNLPENMPLVQEKVKESQNTVGLNLQRVFLTILLLGFTILFLMLFLNR